MIGKLIKACMLGLVTLVLFTTVQPVEAQGWDYDMGLYLFALGMDGSMTVRGQESDVDVSFSDILEDLEMAASLHLDANKRGSNWGWLFDVFWASLGQNLERPNGEYDMNMAYVEGAGTYNLGENFELLAGLRYISMDLTLDIRPEIPPIAPRRFEGDQSWTDLMIGGRVGTSAGKRWRFWARGDLAGFGISDSSDLTWNVVLMGQVKVAKRVGLLLGYRWLDIDYENKDDLFAMDVLQSGPMLAISYSFY